ncbi:unnamed protein product [Prorocentrum cordatum]|uniref:Uncharacterized protein n=1 Tax=Prorocentrum cordatum TaxID=2364126 RepID=A0ABN9USU5_9DINO|nr:unnamed protein product [Polarella glacialis]
MRPSVGSWLSAKPNFEIIRLKEEPRAALREAERKPFHLRPSVGTWLAPRPRRPGARAGVRAAAEVPAHQRHDEDAFLQDQLISTFQSELARKDKEIEDLEN